MPRKSKYKDDVIRLHSQGVSDWDICKELGCQWGAVQCFLRPGYKEKRREYYKRTSGSLKGIFTRKVCKFQRPYQEPKNRAKVHTDYILFFIKVNTFKQGHLMSNLTTKQVYDKYGDSTKCYLTGEHIDLTKPRTYHFDHKVPRSRGGEATIDNLGICTGQANRAKQDLTPEEFLEFCRKVLVHNGYDVTKSTTQTLAEQDEYASFRE